MRCSQINQRLNDPAAADDPELTAHIAGCAACRGLWEAERQLRVGLASVRGHSHQEQTMGSAAAWVRSVVEEERKRAMKPLLRHPFITSRRRWALTLTAAAALLVLFVLVPFPYDHTIGTQLSIKSASDALARVDIPSLQARLSAGGLPSVNIRKAADQSGSTLTYFVSGSSDQATAAFNRTRDLIPGLEGDTKVSVEPWRVRASGSLLAQIASRVLTVRVSSAGKTDAQVEEEIRSQLSAQGMQMKSVSYTRDAKGQTTIDLEGSATTGDGTAQVTIEDVRKGAAANDSVKTNIVLAAPDSTLSSADRIAAIRRQLAEQGITDAEISITSDGKIEVKAKKTKL